ncbi:hypothetical protein RJ640_022278 [Escallonia rubra]|uniref:Bromo domain-containing protein n=1 Tax=Escallonia rubra TaxID=112253 RepID=A0AA88UNB5_9ASTE|nr:hypothetical protein RJ640_022278 [Escallonia rubra]
MKKKEPSKNSPMAKATETCDDKRTWSTWDEMLLACAVQRYGLKDWDFVATELQKRSSVPVAYTAQICRDKFCDLKHRLAHDGDGGGGDDDVADIGSLIEELRKLRVAELEQDIHRRDLKIDSLQLRAKRLKEEEEREQKNGSGEKKPDLVKDSEGERSESEKVNSGGPPAGGRPGDFAGKSVSGVRQSRSFNESNSTENREAKVKVKVNEPVKSGSVKPDPDVKPVREDSCNDSSDTVAKQHAASRPSEEEDGKKVEGDSAELLDSGAEMSSDVQSSVSLTNKVRRKREVPGVGGGGDEPVLSPATIKREPVKSEPLVSFLDVIRSHKHGSMFERRLESQCGLTAEKDEDDRETEIQSRLRLLKTTVKPPPSVPPSAFWLSRKPKSPKPRPKPPAQAPKLRLCRLLHLLRHPTTTTNTGSSSICSFRRAQEDCDDAKTDDYNNMIRQHVDLETVQTRLDDGSYASCPDKFYLDLLLLFNNAIVFYPKSSPQSAAAHDLRKVVLKELKRRQIERQQPTEAAAEVLEPKPDPERSESLLSKHKASAPIVVCRKRSSILAKPSSEKQADEKTASNPKPPVKSSSNEEEAKPTKEKPVTGVRSMRRSNTSRPNSTRAPPSKNVNSNSSSNPDSKSKAEVEASKVEKEKKKVDVGTSVKKRGAADFLKRIKKNSPGKATLLERLKSSPDEGNGSGKKDQQKKKVDDRKDGTARLRSGSGGGKQVKEESSPSKRGVGRPPKKGAKEAVAQKKGGGDEAEVVASKRPNKRSRR